jgi:hypothetical protein
VSKFSPSTTKQAKAVFTPSTGKTPYVYTDPESTYSNSVPIFRLSLMDMGGPWSWRKTSSGELNHVFEGIKSYESMTFSQISEKTSCGVFPTEKICRAAQARLEQIAQTDAALFKLRITKRGRVWAVHQGVELRILWWDPHHTVYPSAK